MLSESDKALLDEFADKVRAEFPDAKIWAYGSRARGEAEPDSDFDICVGLTNYTKEADDRIGKIAWEINVATDFYVMLSVIVLEEESMKTGVLRASPFVKNVLREGIAA